MKVFFTTASPPGTGTYLDLFRRLAAMDRFGVHRVVEDPAQADVVLFVDARDWRLNAIRTHPLVARYREKAFIYNEMDRPWWPLPGLYPSASRRFYNPRRQRACRYVAHVNPYVEQRSHSLTPDLLFSFMGRRCHATRDRILAIVHPRAHIEDTTAFNFFGPSGSDADAQKQRYADILARSKFVLCPRGSGPSSFRLFETLAAGRVPVVISDDWVAPEGPDWQRIALIVPEAKVDRIPAIVEAHEDSFPRMARAARQAWEDWFADDVVFHRMVESCREMLETRRVSEAIWQRLPSPRYLELFARETARKLLDRMGGR